MSLYTLLSGVSLTTMKFSAAAVVGAGVLAGLAGCADTDSHGAGNIAQRQDSAVKDPFSYGPSEGKSTSPTEPEPSKRDDSLDGEWKRAWNP